MPTLRELRTKHTNFDPHDYKRLELLYRGGKAVQCDEFLPSTGWESQTFHEERLLTSMDPILATTINHYVSLLFSKPLQVLDSADATDPTTSTKPLSPFGKQWLNLFQTNCDRKGTSLHNYIKDDFRLALTKSHTYTIVDFPTIDEEQKPLSLAQQREAGLLNGYLCRIPVEEIIDWQYDDFGKLLWFKRQQFCCEKQDAFSDLGHYELYTVVSLQPDPKDNTKLVAVWEKFRSRTVVKDVDPELSEDELAIADQPIITSFQEIPISCLGIPDSTAIGPLIAPMVEELYRLDSFINASANRNVVTIPWIRKAGVIGSNGNFHRSSNATDPAKTQRVEGWLQLTENEDTGILETQGSAIKVLQEQREKLVQRINTAVHQLSQNVQVKSQAQAASAAAKQEDRKDTEIMLHEYHTLCINHTKRLIRFILNQIDEEALPDVKGLNIEDDVDRSALIAEAQTCASIPIKSKIFQVNYQYELATRIVDNLSEDQCQEMKEQIATGVDALFAKDGYEQQTSSIASLPPNDPSGDVEQETPAEPPALGQSGHIALPEGAHIQSGQHIDPRTIYDQLEDDYKPSSIEWVLSVPWQGPVEVPLSSIDFSNTSNWRASKEPEEVAKFVDLIANQGFAKPIILANELSNSNKMIIIDGHHRSLAYKQLNQNAIAYVAHIGSLTNDMRAMHGQQGSDQESSQQSSQQSNQVDQNAEPTNN